MHPADRESWKRPVFCAEQIRASASQGCRLSKPSLVECLLVASPIGLGATANAANGTVSCHRGLDLSNDRERSRRPICCAGVEKLMACFVAFRGRTKMFPAQIALLS
jgi:hypothetical protein